MSIKSNKYKQQQSKLSEIGSQILENNSYYSNNKSINQAQGFSNNNQNKSFQKRNQINTSFNLKAKLTELNNKVNAVYSEIDQNKQDLNVLKVENEKMEEYFKKTSLKMEKKLKETVDFNKLHAEDRLLTQKNSNKEYYLNIKILKDEHLLLNNKLSILQKKIQFLENHVGI